MGAFARRPRIRAARILGNRRDGRLHRPGGDFPRVVPSDRRDGLVLLFPLLATTRIVGTDIAHAVPITPPWSGHALFAAT
jgi:hypothetical protein